MVTSFRYRALPALGTLGLLLLWLAASTRSILYMVESFFGIPVALDKNTASSVAASAICAVFEFVFSTYILAIHLLAFGFPLRACWAVVIMTWEIACARVWTEQRRKNLLVTDDTNNQAGIDSIIHAIIIPNYKETLDTLHDTLDVLATADLAKTNLDIWLAQEEKDPNAKSTAVSLEQFYQGRFRSIQSTFHPTGLLGESQGKSSNVSWAAKQAVSKYEREALTGKEVVFTVMDSDSNLSPDYWLLVAEMHASAPKEDRDISLYVPPLLFDRNTHEVPLLVRLADLAWCAASLSGTYPGSAVCIPTSVYSLPMTLVRSAGGWDAGPDAIGEDMHMFLKCFFATRGDLVTRPVASAASHCNISSSKSGLHGYVDGMVSRWRQGLRHMWGSLDTGYAWRMAPLLFRPAEDDGGEAAPTHRRRPLTFRKARRVGLLFSRLFEAHCLPVQLTVCMIAQALFEAFIPTIITPSPMRFALPVTGAIRPICLILMLIYFTLYRRYHALCLRIRMEDHHASRLSNRSDFSRTKGRWTFWLECCLFPVAGTLYGTAPGFVAQASHLFTDRLDYTVSLKPLRQLADRPLAL